MKPYVPDPNGNKKVASGANATPFSNQVLEMKQAALCPRL